MVYARHAWTAVKRHPARAGLAVAIVIGIALVLVATRDVVSPSMPPFRFLAGQKPALMIRDHCTSWGIESQDFYTFTGDFAAVCAAAQAELSPLGYVQDPPIQGDFHHTRQWHLSLDSPWGIIFVRIRERAELKVTTTPKNSQYSSSGRYNYGVRDGWVTVEVSRNREQSWARDYLDTCRTRLNRLRGK